MSKKVDRILISQPDGWVASFKAQAARDGISLSEFIGACCIANVDKDLLPKVTDRQKALQSHQSRDTR